MEQQVIENIRSQNQRTMCGYHIGMQVAVVPLYIDTLVPVGFRKPVVAFDTPPAEGELVVAKYKISPMYKNENYVLDLTVELQFGEGV